MRHSLHLAVIFVVGLATFAPTLGKEGDEVELTGEQVLNDQQYDVKQSQHGQAKIKAVGVETKLWINGKLMPLSEMVGQMKETTQRLKLADESLRLNKEFEKLLDNLQLDKISLMEGKQFLGKFQPDMLKKYNYKVARFKYYINHPDLKEGLTSFKSLYKQYTQERSVVKGAGGVLPKELALRNVVLKNYIIPRKPSFAPIVAMLLGMVLIPVSILLLAALTSPDQKGASSETDTAIKKHVSSPKALMREGCMELQSLAARVEGIAIGELSVKQYYSLMEALKPVWDEGYQVASRSAAENLAAEPITSWGNATAAPLDPVIPDGATDAEKHRLDSMHAEAYRNWTVTEFMRPVHSQFQFAQKYHEDIHEAAFVHMKNSNALSFAADSSHFKQAYTGMYARYNILPECSPYVHEDKVTTAWFKEGRAKQAVLLANSTAALDIHFAARTALSDSETPLDFLSVDA